MNIGWGIDRVIVALLILLISAGSGCVHDEDDDKVKPLSAPFVLAVGDNGTILHYDGSTWSAMDIDADSTFEAVWGCSGLDLFAVGWNGDYVSGGWEGVIFHYGGSGWKHKATTKPLFIDLWGYSESDVYAIGYLQYSGSAIIRHYDGSSWSEAASFMNETLLSIWGFPGHEMFAAGTFCTIMHYDGSSWSVMTKGTFGNLSLRGIWGSCSSDVFAVGEYCFVLHYDGDVWSEMENETACFLTEVWGSSDSDVFAVGGRDMFPDDPDAPLHGIVLHYDGLSWSEVYIVSDPESELNDVWGFSGSDVFAVGKNGTIMHYDGSQWIQMESGTDQTLRGVWGISDE